MSKEGTHLMPKPYYTNTTISRMSSCALPHVGVGVVLRDILTGWNAHYMMYATIMKDVMSIDIQTMPYSKAQRYKFFQYRVIHNIELPFEVDVDNIKTIDEVNNNYVTEL